MPDRVQGARTIALAGPGGAGKTSLAEAMLFAAGASGRQGSVANGTSIGDASPEARARGGSTELNLMHYDYMDDRYALIDCPGSVGFAADGTLGIAAADLALVVVEPDPDRALLAEPTLRRLEALGIPHMIFVNKIDQARGSIRGLLEALSPMSASPLIARWLPIRDGERVTGFVDIALERAYFYRPGEESELRDIPAELAEREVAERQTMLEQLADHDDALLEQLLMDEIPDRQKIYADLAAETGKGQIVPVLFGMATNGWGVRRLMKALRHEVPDASATAARLGATAASALVFKVSHGGTMGRMNFARVFGGALKEGAELSSANAGAVRVGSLFAMQGDKTAKIPEAAAGDVVAIAKLDEVGPGEWIASGKLPPSPDIAPPTRNAALAISTRDRKDDVRLSTALHRLTEEDAGLAWEQDEAMHETRLRGVNDEHLNVALERLRRRYGVAVESRAPSVGYKESIRKTVSQRGRHKKQSGGHGQFGDVVIEVGPRERGEGFGFDEKIHGGSVPKQYIPAVEQGVRDAMHKGPLGFPVVDVAVTLVDGSYHSVDSSELAFRTAGRIGMADALAAAAPHLLEPVQKVTVTAPNSATSKVASAIASRRGQMLGMGPREGWSGWDRIEAFIPEAEMHGLDAELRSLSQGLATYEAEFEHLAELNGKLADEVVQRELEPA